MRLTQCPRCQRFADKYVEYDFVVIFIDLVLIKPQVKLQFKPRKLTTDKSHKRFTDISSSTDSVAMMTDLT